MNASSIVFSPCLFSLLINDIHILDPASFIPLAFNHFGSQLALMGLTVQSHKCTTSSPFSLPIDLKLHHSFYCPPDETKVLGVPFGSMSLSSSLLQDVLDEDV